MPLDFSKIIKYALIHDFVEVYAGDVNTFASDSDRAKKRENEAVALARLEGDIIDFGDMIQHLVAYEEKSDEEARFVWTVDKIQSLVLADLDSWRPYKKIGITYDRFMQKHQEQLEGCSVYCRDMFSDILAYCMTTYYDNPINKSL